MEKKYAVTIGCLLYMQQLVAMEQIALAPHKMQQAQPTSLRIIEALKPRSREIIDLDKEFCFSPDSRYLLTRNATGFHVWDLKNQAITEIKIPLNVCRTANTCVFSGDGTVLIIPDDIQGKTYIFDLKNITGNTRSRIKDILMATVLQSEP